MVFYSWRCPAVLAVQWEVLALACLFTLSSSEANLERLDALSTARASAESTGFRTFLSTTNVDSVSLELSSTLAQSTSKSWDTPSGKTDSVFRGDGILAALQGQESQTVNISLESTVMPVSFSTMKSFSKTTSELKNQQERFPSSSASVQLNSIDSILRYYNVPTLQPPQQAPLSFYIGSSDKLGEWNEILSFGSNDGDIKRQQPSRDPSASMLYGEETAQQGESYSFRGSADAISRHATVSNEDPNKRQKDTVAETDASPHVFVIAACVGAFGTLGVIAYRVWKSYMVGPTDYRAAWRDAFSKGPQRQRIRTDLSKSGIFPTVLGRQTREPEYRPL